MRGGAHAGFAGTPTAARGLRRFLPRNLPLAELHQSVVSFPRSRVGVAAMVAVCLAGGCAFRSGYDDLGSDPGSDAGADGDPGAGPDAGPAPATPCGSMALLRDDFGDTVTGAQWYSTVGSGVRVVETAGHLAIALGTGTAGVEGRYTSRNAYDLRASSIAATVLRTTGEYTAIEVRDPDRRGGAIGVERTTLVALVLDDAIETQRAQVAYDPARHRHWRLREAGGTLHWETSADLATWSLLHAEPLPMTGTLAHARLVAWGQTTAGGEAWFDDVNLPAPAMPGFCPASSVRDDFDDGVVARSYNNWSSMGPCTGREVDGAFELSFSGSGDAWCGVETRQLVDLRDDAISIEVPTAPGFSTAEAFFEALTPAGDKVQMGRGPGGLFTEIRQGNRQPAWQEIPYDPVFHRFWRLRESGGQTYWDTSADGVTWTNRFSAATAIDVSAVIIDAAAGHWNPGPRTPFVVRYDRLNAP